MLDGNGVITLAGCGSLYLHDLPLPASTTSMPIASVPDDCNTHHSTTQTLSSTTKVIKV